MWVRWCKPRIWDGLRAMGEVGLALVFACVWILIPMIRHMLNTPDIVLLDAAQATVARHFAAADALKYVTAILASSTAYILFRLGSFRSYVYRLMFLVLSPLVLWFLATPLFMESEPTNVRFAGNYAVFLCSAAVFVWWFALFTQRRILERAPVGPSNSGAQGIEADLERNR